MKKSIIAGLICSFLVLFVSCNTESVQEEKQNFNSMLRSSSEIELDNLRAYLSNDPIFNNYAHVSDLIVDEAELIVENGINIYAIVVEKNNVIDGVLFAFKIPADILDSFPNNAEYALLYHQLEDFDLNTSTGKINSYDLNYNKKFMIRSYERKVLTGFDSFEILGSANSTPSNLQSDCSGGSNGNVSWGECYRCLRGACDSDPNCSDMSDVIDIVSTRFGFRGILMLSSLSMGAACVAISAMY